MMTKCDQCRHVYIARPEPEVKAAPVRQVGGITIQPRRRDPPVPTSGAHEVLSDPSGEGRAQSFGRSLREEKIADRLRPLRDKTYFEILRVSPGSTDDQLRRAHAFLMQREAPAKTDPGFQAWKDLIDEAFHALSDRKFADKYARLVADSEMSPKANAQRKNLEVDPKVHRMTLAIAKNALGEASYLNEWARSLDPEREELIADGAFIKFRTAPAAERPAQAQQARRAIEPLTERRRADDRLLLYLVVLISATETIKKAKTVMARVSDNGHPLYEMAMKSLSYATRV
jgi:hypothetical protein